MAVKPHKPNFEAEYYLIKYGPMFFCCQNFGFNNHPFHVSNTLGL